MILIILKPTEFFTAPSRRRGPFRFSSKPENEEGERSESSQGGALEFHTDFKGKFRREEEILFLRWAEGMEVPPSHNYPFNPLCIRNSV
jgi:hypothetical protein